MDAVRVQGAAMSDRIELSDGEIGEVARWLRGHMVVGDGSFDAARDAVYSIRDFVNRLRAGDPVGTIRRDCSSPGVGGVAVRVLKGWTVVYPGADIDPHESEFYGHAVGFGSWKLVYSPEEQA